MVVDVIEFMRNGGHRSTFAGNSALLPSDVMDFVNMLSAQRLLARISFMAKCHATSKSQPMSACAVGEKSLLQTLLFR